MFVDEILRKHTVYVLQYDQGLIVNVTVTIPFTYLTVQVRQGGTHI